ncbi:hypothetical protein [Sulfurimonas microaerophilic]|uniref:hypothetical protein n=1 Tax=Sulfurimonas microaerophilic TaxID=3058392 RepID=UPI0027147CB3|nr:hypothetical protein [Sulfurimonas sp. hsl 1-7]
MATYYSDGKKLVDVEYDTIVEVGDIVDGMRVLSTNAKSHDEYAVFLLEPNTRVTCYVFDEVFIIGKMDGFENLAQAAEAWNNDEI